MSDNKRAMFIKALRDCARFLEAHPGLPVPGDMTLNVFVSTADELATIARAASWSKYYDNHFVALRQTFAGILNLDFNIARELVCRRVVKGTRVVPAQIVDDVEWVCDDALLAQTSSVES